MVTTPPIKRLRGHKHALGIDLIDFALAQFVERGLKRVYPAWGTAEAPEQATVSGSPRLVLGIAGRNVMLASAGRIARECSLVKGDLCFVHTQSWNQPLHVHAKTFLTIDIKRDRIRYYLRQTTGPGSLPAECTMQWVLRTPDPCTRHLIAACEQVMGQEQRLNLLHGMTEQLLQQLLFEWRQAEKPSDATALFMAICDYIDEHLHQDLDRRQVAQAHAVHPNHISRLFRQQSGQRFVDFVTEQRLQRANALLAQGSISIAQTAKRCGFSSSEYFCTVYKKAFGQSPGRAQRTKQSVE